MYPYARSEMLLPFPVLDHNKEHVLVFNIQ